MKYFLLLKSCMSFDTPSKVKDTLSQYDFKPAHRLGQNFIIDKNIINKIVQESQIKPNDHILEIGPGLGVLTDELSERAKKVLAVDIDKKIINILENEFDWPNVRIIKSDILKISNKDIAKHLGSKKYKLIANLPYQITSEIIAKFLKEDPKPECMVIMVQREVGERMLGQAPHTNLLALMVEFYSNAKKLFRVSKNSFYPVPKVESVVMELVPKSKTTLKVSQAGRFWELVRLGYRSKRKYLQNNLASYAKVPKSRLDSSWHDLGWDTKVRPENLSLKDWLALYDKLS